MNLSAPFIRRPVATTLIILAVLIFGVLGYRVLPVSDLPPIDFPTIQVQANLPGASPETMAAAVATPLEKQFSTIAGIDSISSVNAQGNTNITLQFALERDIDAAAQDVQSMIAKTQRQLPPEMPAPPSYQKVNPADAPVLFLALSSETLPLSQVDEYAETVIAQRLSSVSGVAQVSVFGAQKYAVRIDLDPRELASRAIGIDQVAQAIQQSNVNRPTGTLYGPDRAFVIQANGQLTSAATYPPVVVAYRNGTPVRLGEVARVYDGVENDKTASWFNGRRTVYLSIQRQPGTNTVAVVDAIRALLPQLEQQLPASVSLSVRLDRSIPIRQSVDDVKFTLLLTVFLVVLVIFLFLRNLSATVIPSLALPASILGTFAVMYLCGYSLDNLSLMALTLSVGFVVDDAIVMLENIVRHMERGESAEDAAFNASKEISFTILSMTLSLTAVFIPCPVYGGHCWTSDARIRGDDCGRDSGVRCRIADADTDAVQPIPAAAPRGASRAVLRVHRADVRRLVAMVRLVAEAGAPFPRHCDGDVGAASSWHGVPLRGDSQGVHTEPGHGPIDGTDRSRAGNRLRFNGGA
jgi:HAE1 family hydrophobic/amphiphilic exporter-1